MNRAIARKIFRLYIESPIVALMVHLKISPNFVTLIGLLIALSSTYFISAGLFACGGLMLLASGIFDLFDGALARATCKTTIFGALLDSLVDRISEAAILFGLLIWYLSVHSTLGAILTWATLISSFTVSYTRARAEGLGVSITNGIMTRPERVTLMSIGLILGHWWTPIIQISLGIITALSVITTIQRILQVSKNLK